MWLLIATVLAAAVVIVVSRGSFTALTRIRVRAFWLLAAGLIIQAVLEYVVFSKDQIETIGYALLMVSYVLILGFCIANTRTRGFELIAVGVAMNALVIGLNLGMPTRPIGDDSHGNRIYVPVTQTVKHRQETNSDLLGYLGDKILLPRPFDELISVGDVVIAVGICELAFYGSRRRVVDQVAPRRGDAY
jgi:hypothetical protein